MTIKNHKLGTKPSPKRRSSFILSNQNSSLESTAAELIRKNPSKKTEIEDRLSASKDRAAQGGISDKELEIELLSEFGATAQSKPKISKRIGSGSRK